MRTEPPSRRLLLSVSADGCARLMTLLALKGPGDEVNHSTSIMAMSDCHWMRRENLDYMGYTMRTETERYTEWLKWDGKNGVPLWDHKVGVELYAHTEESQYDNSYLDDTENTNLAMAPGNAAHLEELSAQLKAEVAKWMVPWSHETQSLMHN